MRIAYYKKENSDQAGEHDGYKNTLENMFAESNLDLKKRTQRDEALVKVQDLARNHYFEERFHLLAAIFDNIGLLKDEGYQELSKGDFVKLLKDTDILIKPKPQKADDKNAKDKDKKENNEEQKQPQAEVKFEETDAMDAIAKLECFDMDQMDYVDFLEALVRICLVYPFTEE